MKFEKKVTRETREFLTQQLKEYEQATFMTKDERRLLREWVSAGHSPYENGDCVYGAGDPVDFINALHTMQEMDECFADFSDQEKAAELSKGVQYNTATEDIIFDINALNLPDILDEDLPFL